jgi:phosphate transport system substrate-binding protein
MAAARTNRFAVASGVAVPVAMAMAMLSTPGLAQTADQPLVREAILAEVSPLMINFTQAVSDRLVQKRGLPPVTVSSVLADAAVKDFCAGIGPKFPDVIGIPRKLAKREYDKCVENGVIDIVELAVGFDALVLTVRKGDPVFNLTPRAMYFALAAELPHEDEFVTNDIQRWRELDPRLPDIPIHVLGSENGTAISAFFKEIFMEGGCRGLNAFKVYYSKVDRVKTCTTIRDDGHFTPIKAPISINFKEALKNAPPDAVLVVPYTVYRHNTDLLDLLPVLNILPTETTIKDDDYEAVSPVRYYVKRKHMERSLGGIGVARGLYSFIEEAMSEDAIGSGGYLEAFGLVIDDPEDRASDRDKAMRLQPFRR